MLPEKHDPNPMKNAFFHLLAFYSLISPALAMEETIKGEFKITSDVSARDLKAGENEFRTESGILHRILRKGKKSDLPEAGQSVLIHYVEWTEDGKLWDSSIGRGRPTLFQLGGLIRGLEEGIKLMKVGEVRRFWIPPHLAFGKNSRGGRPGGIVVFDVELLEVRDPIREEKGAEQDLNKPDGK